MSNWEEKFNELQSQHESMKKEFEEFKRDKTMTTKQMEHGMLIYNI